MPRYRVLRDCVGFRNGYWKEGQVVEFGASEKPPHHFELVTDEEPAETKVSEPEAPKTMSEINKVNDANKPNTGMAHVPSNAPKAAPQAAKVKAGKLGKK